MAFTPEQGIRYALGAYFTFIAVFYSLRLIRNKTGKKLTFLGKPGSQHWIGHVTFRVFRLLIWGVCVVRIFYEDLDIYLGLFAPLNLVAVNLIGILMMIGGFWLVYSCHCQLKEHWRLGIDETGPEELITTGLYGRTRNPVFIGVVIGQIGFFFGLPSVFSLICLIVGITSILSQIRVEEAYLQQHMPDAYDEYCRSVPRWL